MLELIQHFWVLITWIGKEEVEVISSKAKVTLLSIYTETCTCKAFTVFLFKNKDKHFLSRSPESSTYDKTFHIFISLEPLGLFQPNLGKSIFMWFIILGWLPMGLLFSFKHTWWFFSTINSDLLSEDLGAYCFRSVCYSVIPLSETLILLITFEKWMLVLWYFTWVFHVTNLSVGTNIFDPVTLTFEFKL